MYDASNRKQIREAEKAARRAELDRIEFLKAALNTTQGRTWFYNFLADCHCFVNTPTFNTNQDYTQLGERNAGLRVFAEIIHHCPDQYILMTREVNARDQLRDTRTEHAGSPDPGWGLEGRVEPEQPDAEPEFQFDGAGAESIN